MANLYLQETLPDSAFEAGGAVEVTGDEARHAVRVSRLRLGERTTVGNGAGIAGEGEVTGIDKDRFTVRLDAVRREPEPPTRVTLVQALAKGDRAERAVEQATEFGVDALVPWESTRSVSRWLGKGGDSGEKAARGVAKWQRIAREAAKQSMRLRVPEVASPISTAELCRRAAQAGTEVLVLHPRGSRTLSDWASGGEANGLAEILVVVGPEGGLSDDEIGMLETAGARILCLGDTVLRTSSAGPAALAVLNVALRRW